MDEQEQYEQLQRQRRARREAARRRHERRRRIFFGSILLILLLFIILIFKACSALTSSSKEEVVIEEVQEEEDELIITIPEAEALTITTPEVTTTTIDLVFAGDIMCYDSQISAAAVSGGYDFSSCFTEVSGYISAADLAVANLELNFCGGSDYSGYPSFNAPESLAAYLYAAGFDLMQTANTYSILNGLTGLESTLNYIKAAGMTAVGTYASEEDAEENGVVLKEIDGVTIAFIAFTKGVNNSTVPTGSEYCVDLLYTDYNSSYSSVDTSAITAKVAAAQALEPDFIIALLHWGSEYETSISSSQTQIENLLFENGVDAIIGTHPHVVGGMETKTVTLDDGTEKEVFVAYSLGNFLSSMTTDDTQASVLLNLQLCKDSTGETYLGSISYVPLYIQNDSGDVKILDIYAALEDSSTSSETASLLEDALSTIHSNAGSEYDYTLIEDSTAQEEEAPAQAADAEDAEDVDGAEGAEASSTDSAA